MMTSLKTLESYTSIEENHQNLNESPKREKEVQSAMINMKGFSRLQKLLIIVGVIIPTTLLIVSFQQALPKKVLGVQQQSLHVFSAKELAQFDGTGENEPIYLALDGFVYDVTKGRKFYRTGGPYHDLAGRDSSVALHIAGGGIIKQKYPIIGILKR